MAQFEQYMFSYLKHHVKKISPRLGNDQSNERAEEHSGETILIINPMWDWTVGPISAHTVCVVECILINYLIELLTSATL